MKRTRHWISACMLAQLVPLLFGQAAVEANTANPQNDARYRLIDERLNGLASELERTRGELATAVNEIRRLRDELEQTKTTNARDVSAEATAAILSDEVAK